MNILFPFTFVRLAVLSSIQLPSAYAFFIEENRKFHENGMVRASHYR
jgi:hypothetical protein